MGCGNANAYDSSRPNQSYQKKVMSMPKEIENSSSIQAKPEKIKGSLGNKPINIYNEFALKIKKYWKNQIPPSDTETQYQDDMFPPNLDSVFGRGLDGNPTDNFTDRTDAYYKHFSVKEDEVEWLTADKIYPGKHCLFEGSIECNDIKQGSIGDCYFMSAMSAMAEFPELIVEIFRNLKVTANGCYEVVMRISGIWQIVLLDNFFPCNKDTKKPLFSKGNNAEIWVMLLEKAWAKVNGGYLNINAGLVSDVLSAFTNFPTEYYRFEGVKNKDEIWNKVKDYENKGYIMATTSNFSKEMESVGLVGGHAFTLISAKEARVGGNLVRLLKIRNPWGYKEWSGKWSDNSKAWTDEAKIAFGNQDMEKKDDGCFWMEFKDFLNYFINIETCLKQNNICSRGIQCVSSRIEAAHVFELTLDSKSTVSIQGIKRHWRFNRKIPPEARLILNLILVKKNGNKLQWISGSSDSQSDPLIKTDLEAGNYLIYAIPNYKQHTYDKKRKYIVNVSSSDYFSLRKSQDYDEDYSLLKEIMLSYVTKTGKAKKVNNSQDYVYLPNVDECSLGLVYIKNYSNTGYVLEGRHDLSGCRAIDQDDPNANVSIPLAANGGTALVITTRDEYYTGYSCGASNYEFKEQECEDPKIDISKFVNNFTVDESVSNENEDDNPSNPSNYSWCHKQYRLDMSKIAEKIDQNEIMKNYIMDTYPEKYEKMITYEGPKDGVAVTFQDNYDFGNGSSYLGQWQVDNPVIRHGVGFYDWYDSGNSYCGELKDGKFHGKGCMTWSDGTCVKITYVNGKMHGQGRQYSPGDDVGFACEYENGNFVAWLD